MSTQMTSGSFVNVASTPFFIPLSQKVNKFRLVNLTRSGATSNGITGVLTGDRLVEAEWTPYQSMDTAIIKQLGAVVGELAAVNLGNLEQNGITIFNNASPLVYPQVAIASFVPGATTVFTTGAPHGLRVGDIVRITNMTTALQISGVAMTVTAVGSPTTFTTLLNSSNALTSVGFVQKIGSSYLPPSTLYYPQLRAIASISLANPMVVTTLVQQNYHVGDVVTFQIPTVYGMQNLINKTTGLPFEATISAVNNAVGTQTVTFANVDSSGFEAFAWPDADAYPLGLPVMIPQGEGNTNNLIGVVPTPLPYANQNVLSFATQNLGQNGVLIGAGDGTGAITTGGIIGDTVDAWYWEAFTTTQSFPSV